MQFDYAQDANKRLLNTELNNIERQRNQAAGKIGREAKVRFDLAKDDDNDKSNVAIEYLDMLTKQGKIEAKYQPEFQISEEQSKEFSSSTDRNKQGSFSQSSRGKAKGIDWYQDGRVSKMNLEPEKKERNQLVTSGKSILRTGKYGGLQVNDNNLSVWDLSDKSYR